ncbi:MAG TPA: homoserine dehydrogenase [Vicinamibacterales bacterium]|nr:homoserine dehydrogenase [Vicinamibacterales bacterium]
MRRIDLAIIGFGNVGQRLVTLLDERSARLARDYGVTCRVAGTASRRQGAVFENEACADAFDVIGRLACSPAPTRIVVETTTLDVKNGEPATSHVRAAIAAGCHVVTANKGPVAFAYEALREAAEEAGVRFLFEGTVMDGVPVFNLAREALPAVQILGFEGVVNTTTNHIITALERGETFAAALSRMQEEGIAEADPSLDVEGWDAAAKAAALANVLMDARITPHDVQRRGIDEATGGDARRALANGRRLKLVATARRDSAGMVSCAVGPRELPADHLLAGLDGNANALILETDLLDRIAITQLSSSLTQTAYALLSDIISIARSTEPV